MSDEPRPSTKMSIEEHASIQEVKAEVRGLSNALEKFVVAVDKRFSGLEDKQAEAAKERQFSWGKMLSFVGSGLGIAAAVTALISLSTDNKLAPIITQNQVSINDRASLREEVRQLRDSFLASKEARLANEKAAAVEMAVQKERTSQAFFALYGHYPPN